MQLPSCLFQCFQCRLEDRTKSEGKPPDPAWPWRLGHQVIVVADGRVVVGIEAVLDRCDVSRMVIPIADRCWSEDVELPRKRHSRIAYGAEQRQREVFDG